MAEPDTAARVAAAIQEGRLRELLASTATSSDAFLSRVRHAVDEIDAAVATERARLADAFASAGIATGAIDRTASDRLLIVIHATVDPHEADTAVASAERIGYRRLAPTTPGGWRVYRHVYGGCALVDQEHSERRIEISWRTRPMLKGKAGRVLLPDRSDFDAITLHKSLWFGYFAVHLVRLPRRLMRRRSEPAYLGPFLVTPTALIEPLLRFADVRPGELVVDLGCGDGRILVGAAQLGCLARGIESDPALVDLARAAVSAAAADDRVDVVNADALHADLGDADVVVMFLPVETLRELLPKVLSRLRTGARLVVHEQERLAENLSPDRSAPIVSAAGVTVAHRWDR
jgi:SAM-dependent methyltransferase